MEARELASLDVEEGDGFPFEMDSDLVGWVVERYFFGFAPDEADDVAAVAEVDPIEVFEVKGASHDISIADICLLR